MRLSKYLLAAGTGLAAICTSLPAMAQQAHTVFFALGSAALDAEALSTIDAAAAEHASTGSTSVSIVGHTDTTGSAEYNMRLSQRRAEAVAGALQQRGVPSDQMTLAWRGETELAVQTGDNVAERRNRRAEIAMGGTPAAMPMEDMPAMSRFSIGVGPYVGFSLEDNDESTYLGVNFTATYALTSSIDLSAEQAVFYNTGADDEGWGGRSAVGADWTFADWGGFRPYVGANVGYMYIDGSGTGGIFGGPELGVNYGNWVAKAAYDFVEDRDAEEGVISLTVGYNFRF